MTAGPPTLHVPRVSAGLCSHPISPVPCHNPSLDMFFSYASILVGSYSPLSRSLRLIFWCIRHDDFIRWTSLGLAEKMRKMLPHSRWFSLLYPQLVFSIPSTLKKPSIHLSSVKNCRYI